MIVWLASYPRSGNTLLRQVLKQCFDLRSYESADPLEVPNRGPQWEEASALYGNRFSSERRNDFLNLARQSEEIVPIKTHDLPTDHDRAIYVVRDGRLALESYTRFHQTYENKGVTFSDLLIGNHVYGDWTTHYRSWNARPDVLIVRFEQLVDAGEEFLDRLARFLGYQGPIRPWINPQQRLQKLVPTFFGGGQKHWARNEFWTTSRLAQFATLHGPLACELGYLSDEDRQHFAYPAGSGEEEILLRAIDFARRQQEMLQACNDRLEAIRTLTEIAAQRLEQVDRLEAECATRLEHVHRLNAICGERQSIIDDLNAVCEGRLETIHRLDAECASLRRETEQYRSAIEQAKQRSPLRLLRRCASWLKRAALSTKSR